MGTARAGVALVLSLLIALVLECVVLGTMYLALQERRIADNGTRALRLRFAAENAAVAGAAAWPSALDSLAPGQMLPPVHSIADGLAVNLVYQRVDSALVLVYAESLEPPPALGRASAVRLIAPPILPPDWIPAAALLAGAGARLRTGSLLSAVPTAPCPDDSVATADALRIADPASVQLDDPAALDGAIAAAGLPTDLGARARAAAALLPAVHYDSAGGAARLAIGGSGVIAVDGDLVVDAGVQFDGLAIVTGALVVAGGAELDGVVLVGGTADIAGSLRFSRCAALASARTAGLTRPRPLPRRSVVPAF